MEGSSGSQPIFQRPYWVIVFAGALLGVGAGLIFLGGVVPDLTDYEQSVFAHLGTALLFVVPVFIAERVLDHKVRKVGDHAAAAEKEVTEARHDLQRVSMDLENVSANLDQAVAKAVRETRSNEQEGAAQAAEGDLSSLFTLFNRASHERWLHRMGLRVRSTANGLWMRASEPFGTGARLEFSFEDAELKRVGKAQIWTENLSAEKVFIELIEGLKEAPGQFPGDDAISVDRLLHDLVESVRRVAELHIGPEGDQGIQPVIELVGSEWAVTEFGLESTVGDIGVSTEELSKADLTYDAVLEKVRAAGFDEDNFSRAFSDAVQIHAVLPTREKEWNQNLVSSVMP